MIKEVFPKSQYLGEFRRCFLDEDTGRDMIVWYENFEMSELLSVQFEDRECRILKLNFDPSGKTFWHSYERDVLERTVKDLLFEVPLRDELVRIGQFADFLHSVPDLGKLVERAVLEREGNVSERGET